MAQDAHPTASDLELVAGNGLLHRRLFLKGSALLGAAGVGLLTAREVTAAPPPPVAEWMRAPGAPMSAYGSRSRFEQDVARIVGPPARGTTGAGSSRTPLERLTGMITPNGLHFERHHSGIPDIDPDAHRLLIHGLVDRPLIFSMEALHRYPMVSRIQFLECSGNSRINLNAEPADRSAGGLHGLVSCSEWTGIPLGVLLDEAGVNANARWLLAEGSDAAAMTRSVPLAKAMDDAMLALYQNGEALRPGQGYPMRLFLPGWEGNISVKWLRRIKLMREPTMTKDETSKYTDLMPDGTAEMFTFPMGVKSLITSPAGGLTMQGPGLYEISGIAWSGAGRIRRVEVSADGGASWGEAALTEPVLPKALTRFRMPWQWDGGPAVLLSRATDESGAVQPTRAAIIAEKGVNFGYHNNAIQSWHVAPSNEVKNVFV
jgi:sulfane dehydrogenase subunit SoxC